MDSYIGRHAVYCVQESTNGWLNMTSIFGYGDDLYNCLNDFLDKAEEFAFKD